MKKFYTKPLISVEVMSLDQPIAGNCTADYDDMKDLNTNVGYFSPNDKGMTCTINILDHGDVDWTGDGIADGNWGDDSICYHSNIATAFLS